MSTYNKIQYPLEGWIPEGDPACGGMTMTAEQIPMIVQAICNRRNQQKHAGQMFVGRGTGVAPEVQRSVMERLVANGIEVRCQKQEEAVSFELFFHVFSNHNRYHTQPLPEGIFLKSSPFGVEMIYCDTSGQPVSREVVEQIFKYQEERTGNNTNGFSTVRQRSRIVETDFMADYQAMMNSFHGAMCRYVKTTPEKHS